MLTIINCTGNKHVDFSPAKPTGSQKNLVLFCAPDTSYTNSPIFSQTLHNISHPGIWHNKKIIFKLYFKIIQMSA